MSSRLRVAALALLCLLGVAVLAWQRERLLGGNFWPLLFVLPLLAPVRGLARGRRYTYAWSTLLVIGYIALGITETLVSPATRALPALILFLAFALFLVLVAFLRVTAARAPR